MQKENVYQIVTDKKKYNYLAKKKQKKKEI